jgi:microcystin-dependent protein
MSDTFIGQILLFPFNFAPVGFALCNGQLINIAQNTALFSLLGTTFGGNGQTTFALPDLRGRAPLAFGQGPGLDVYDMGQVGGSETIALTASHMPAHTHTLNVGGLTANRKCQSGQGNQSVAASNVYGAETVGSSTTFSSAPPDADMQSGALSVGGAMTAVPSGGGQGHENRQPYLVLNYCIATTGVFPPRS